MRTKRILFVQVLLVTTVSLGFGGNTNNPHNVNNEDWGTNGRECKVCHPLQNSFIGEDFNPIWNASASNKIYNVYGSPTLNAWISQPDGSSKLCLSCHDGTIASDNTGMDLSNDHPVSFTYNSALAGADKGLNDPSITLSGMGGTIEKDLLKNGKMQCTSCHNPHQSKYPYHLIMNNEKSDLCFKCHNK